MYVLRPCVNLTLSLLPNNYSKISVIIEAFEIFTSKFEILFKFDSFTNLSFIIGYKLHKVSKFFKIMSYSFY